MTMRATKERLMEEAIKRMKALGITSSIIEDFQKNQGLTIGMENGYCFQLDDQDRKRIQELEKKFGVLAYAAIRSQMDCGRMISYIIVSSYEAEWELEHMFMGQGAFFAYVYNYDVPIYSEMGNVYIKCLPGGILERIG